MAPDRSTFQLLRVGNIRHTFEVQTSDAKSVFNLLFADDTRRVKRRLMLNVSIDRATLCRWKKLVGDKLGDTVVKAMAKHALATAFCISTDATGVAIQPIYSHEEGSGPCQKVSSDCGARVADTIDGAIPMSRIGSAENGVGFHLIVLAQRERLYTMLMRAASETLLTLAHDNKRLGATPAITMVLHTWTRELLFHPHVHAIVSAGGLSMDAQPRWIRGHDRYLFPVKVMAKLFRRLFRDALLQAIEAGAVTVPNDFESTVQAALFDKRWVVYVKAPFGGADQVFNYLGRYTHRVGISNARIRRSDAEGVTFATKNGRTCTLPQVEFLRRLLLHVLPKGFHKIRHYGLCPASHVRLGTLKRARSLLGPCDDTQLPKSELGSAPQTWVECLLALTGVDILRCPRCEAGQMIPQPLATSRLPTFNDTS